MVEPIVSSGVGVNGIGVAVGILVGVLGGLLVGTSVTGISVVCASPQDTRAIMDMRIQHNDCKRAFMVFPFF
jgi:hypothetical protein